MLFGKYINSSESLRSNIQTSRDLKNIGIRGFNAKIASCGYIHFSSKFDAKIFINR